MQFDFRRLAVHFRTRWCEKEIAYKSNHDKYPDFKEFVSFLDIIASEVNDPIYGFGSRETVDSKPQSTCRATAASPQVPKRQCPLSSKNNWLHRCFSFFKMSVTERVNFVSKNNLCQICFNVGHDVSNCNMTFSCGLCGERHSSFLHLDKVVKSNAINVSSSATAGTYMPIVMCTVNNLCNVFSLLDSASTNTLIS